jgi:arginase
MPTRITHGTPGDGAHLRLLCPQWQGAGTSSVRELASEFPLRRGAARLRRRLRGSRSHPAAPRRPHRDRTSHQGDDGLDLIDGVEAKAVIVDQLTRALQVIEHHAPARIATLGGECAVSVAPFSALAHRYGDDLAILWIDSHPDIGTPASQYPGFHAIAVAALTGHGDPDILKLLPGTVRPHRVALVGLHVWTEDDFPNVADWGIQTFSPDHVRNSTQPLLDWLAATGCSRVAIHFDVDTVDSNEIVLGLGAVPDGLTSQQVRRIVADLTAAADVVALTIAEFFPRQVMHLQQILDGFPLITPPAQ